MTKKTFVRKNERNEAKLQKNAFKRKEKMGEKRLILNEPRCAACLLFPFFKDCQIETKKTVFNVLVLIDLTVGW
jgi:hypothetical protein